MAESQMTTEAGLMVPAQRFVDAVRGLFADGLAEEDLWTQVAVELRILLDDPALKAHTANWPDTKKGGGPPSNLLFYEDPDYGFVLNALVKAPGAVTNVHDHGKSWTLYGVLEGGEHIERYRRVDDNPTDIGPATLDPDGSFDVTPGYIDVVPPWQIHQEINGDHRTIGFIVRSQRSGTFRQFRYQPDTGGVTEYNGPTQIPFELA